MSKISISTKALFLLQALLMSGFAQNKRQDEMDYVSPTLNLVPLFENSTPQFQELIDTKLITLDTNSTPIVTPFGVKWVLEATNFQTNQNQDANLDFEKVCNKLNIPGLYKLLATVIDTLKKKVGSNITTYYSSKTNTVSPFWVRINEKLNQAFELLELRPENATQEDLDEENRILDEIYGTTDTPVIPQFQVKVAPITTEKPKKTTKKAVFAEKAETVPTTIEPEIAL